MDMPNDWYKAELERVRSRANQLETALQAFTDAHDAQWGDLDVWLDWLNQANDKAKELLGIKA